MSKEGDATIAVYITTNPVQQAEIGKDKLLGSKKLYLKAYQMWNANSATNKVIFVQSNRFRLTNADSTVNLKGGEGIHLPVIADSFYYEFNTPYPLRATTLPQFMDFVIYNQAGVITQFAANWGLVLYLEMR